MNCELEYNCIFFCTYLLSHIDFQTPYSYRVVHQNDLVPHLPPKTFDNWFDGAYHHRYEVWYDNSMVPGSTFEV